ncbi:extensin-like domain-containing protein [Aureimonas glaciei]|uniref:extensin-like domain-containing protein n=1 Tax=Aureimonas glaciei TaxID=1776957 RepID=UPI001665270A|nr:extensin family protein [Aureimonas glaciei]
MTVAKRSLLVLGCLLMVGTAPMAQAAGLPWKDANPLERLFGPSKPAKSQTRHRPRPARSTPAKAAPALAAIPIPDARPDRAEAAKEEPAAAPESVGTEVVAAPDAKNSSDAGPSTKLSESERDSESGKDSGSARDSEPTKASEATKDTDATKDNTAAKASEANKASEAAPSTAAPDAAVPDPAATPTPVPAPADAAPETAEPQDAPADPAATATMPIDDIPVPAVRPEGAGDDAEKPGTVPETQDPVRPPAEPAPAPNSTENLKSRTATVTPAATVLAAAAIEDAELCEAELKKRGVDFTVGESISEGECGVLRPVNVKRLSSGIEVSPDTQFLCRTALALDDWMTSGVLPAVKTELPGRKLSQFRHASTYVCRPRASESGISEHARGSAIDIAAFVFDESQDIGVEAQAADSPEAKFQASVRAAACGPFKTVLGPGTDPDHATHFHLDIAARKNGSTYCK